MSDVPVRATDEIGLLDIAVILAENWLLIMLTPLLAGLVAFGTLWFATPRIYDSEALLRINATDAAMLRSARVLNPAMIGSTYLQDYDGSLSSARQELISSVMSINAESGTDMYRVRISVDNAEDAHDLLQRIINSLIKNSTPTTSQAKLIEIRLEQARAATIELESNLERLNDLFSAIAAQGGSTTTTTLGDIGQSTVTLVNNIEQRHAQIFQFEEQLAGTVSAQDVVQEATMPDGPRSRGLVSLVLLAVVGAGLLAMIIAFVKSGIEAASRNPHQIDKVNRIRRAFWLKPLDN